MVCVQIKAYLVFLVIQTLISVALVGPVGLHIFGPLVFLCILYLLCKYKHFTVANVLVAVTVVLGIGVDLYALTDRRAIKHELHIQAEHRDKVKKPHTE